MTWFIDKPLYLPDAGQCFGVVCVGICVVYWVKDLEVALVPKTNKNSLYKLL